MLVSRTPLRILVAEDSEVNAQLMEKLLAKRGYQVRVVGDGREALGLASHDDFDLLLLDVHMPEMDGFEVIGAIRQREQGTDAHLPVIALTARSRKEDRDRCLAAGMDEFLAKPIQAESLWAAIDRVLEAFPFERADASRLLDPRVLLAACGGDQAILHGICEALRSTLPGQLATVKDALEKGDAAGLRESAHKLCGMVAAFSTVAGSVASDLEDYAARVQLEEARPLAQELGSILDELLKVVSNNLTVQSLRDAQPRGQTAVVEPG